MATEVITMYLDAPEMVDHKFYTYDISICQI